MTKPGLDQYNIKADKMFDSLKSKTDAVEKPPW